jgi:hypothetical protein
MYGRSLWFDIRKARELLGYAPRFSNIEMLCHSYDWYLAHRDETLTRRAGSLHSLPVKQRLLRLLPAALAWLPAAKV